MEYAFSLAFLILLHFYTSNIYIDCEFSVLNIFTISARRTNIEYVIINMYYFYY